MDNIKIENAKNLGKEFAQKINDYEKSQSKEFEELAKQLEAYNFSGEDLQEISALLSLPEEQFGLIGDIFLEEMEKEYNKDVNKNLTIQMLNASGKTLQDFQEEYKLICQGIDSAIKSNLSAQKRDFLKRMLGIVYNSISEADGIASKIVQIPVELCNNNSKLPAYAHETDAGLDIYALEDITIAPGETKIIPTGIKVAIPAGYELQVRAKSGRCVKTKLRVANAPGTIDAGYRDEIGVILDNIEPFIKKAKINIDGTLSDVEYGQSYTIGKGEKFAQLVLSEVPKVSWIEVDSVKDIANDGRAGGYGSTGLK